MLPPSALSYNLLSTKPLRNKQASTVLIFNDLKQGGPRTVLHLINGLGLLTAQTE